jgi:arylsulfatase A-like enzyme
MRRITESICSRSSRRWFALLTAGLAIVFHAAAAIADPLPNIVYILADDMGLGDISSYTANSPVATPNIDRIANAGMRFNDAHSSDGVCTPSRYSLMTGQYAWRGAILAGVAQPYQNALIPSSRLTVAEMLQQSGYSTGMFGKWHLGENWVTTGGGAASNGSNVDHTQPFTGGPVNNGFDTYFGIAGSASEGPYSYLRDNRVVGQDLVTPCSAGSPGSCPTGQTQGNPSASINLPGPVSPGFDISNNVPIISNQAVSYISQKANQANPFFMYYPMTAPHVPIDVPSFAVGQSGVTGAKQAYGDFIWTVDWAVGQVLNALEDPNHDGNKSDSILNNTIVVFAADNGADTAASFSTSVGKINGVQMAGGKSSLLEGGHRVPFVVQWNGHVPAGTSNDHYVDLTDFMATTASIVNYNLPSNAAEDSVNILPELTGSATKPVRSTGITHSYWGDFGFRQTDEAGNQWQMLFSTGDGGFSDSPGSKFSPTDVITDFTKVQLYNLKNDPGETTNLLAGGGTLAMQQKALQLQGLVQDRILSGRSTNIPAKSSVNGTSTILIDFGDSSRQTPGTGWNNISGATSTSPVLKTTDLNGMGLYDSGGGYSGIVVKTKWTNASSDTGVASLANAYNGPYPASLSDIPSTALSDGVFVRNGNKLTISLESLDPHATYDLQFYAAASSGPTYSLFTITGSTTQQVHIAPLAGNSTQAPWVMGVVPDSFNRISIDLEGRAADGVTNGSGWLNFMRIVEHLLEVPGDFNGDRIVDSADYFVWRSAFGTTGTSSADANHDGIVDGADYLIWRKAMSAIAAGSGSSISLPSGTIPEPTSATLLTVAMTGLMLSSSRGYRISRLNRRA